MCRLGLVVDVDVNMGVLTANGALEPFESTLCNTC